VIASDDISRRERIGSNVDETDTTPSKGIARHKNQQGRAPERKLERGSSITGIQERGGVVLEELGDNELHHSLTAVRRDVVVVNREKDKRRELVQDPDFFNPQRKIDSTIKKWEYKAGGTAEPVRKSERVGTRFKKHKKRERRTPFRGSNSRGFFGGFVWVWNSRKEKEIRGGGEKGNRARRDGICREFRRFGKNGVCAGPGGLYKPDIEPPSSDVFRNRGTGRGIHKPNSPVRGCHPQRRGDREERLHQKKVGGEKIISFGVGDSRAEPNRTSS